ncbi:MAG: hypothetical protein HN730_10015, partial [Bdellovibrionales bacterium]|nr:hypothetical protein [Bdellovibrionales bacterium]
MKIMQNIICIVATLFCTLTASAAITRSELDSIFDTFHSIYDPKLSDSEVIQFNPRGTSGIDWWEIEQFRASYFHYQSDETGLLTRNIWLFGGMARKPFMTV